jgi:hypothetical protein
MRKTRLMGGSRSDINLYETRGARQKTFKNLCTGLHYVKRLPGLNMVFLSPRVGLSDMLYGFEGLVRFYGGW